MYLSLTFAQHILLGLRFSLVMLIICGLVYSGSITLLGSLLFPHQADASLIKIDGKIYGSALVAQTFTEARYFQGRPSAVGNDPMATEGSNLAPSNPALRDRAQADSLAIQAKENIKPEQIPVDLISASGSGIDPHISPAAAAIQIPRIANARGISESALADLVSKHTEHPQWQLFGQARVNVLLLNLDLDQLVDRTP